jgi:hypothetical protein
MTIVSGHCVLVIDGTEYGTYSYAFELPGTSAVRRLGFLSGPSEYQIRLGGISIQCAQILLGAVTEGEQDPERLKHIVLQKVRRPGH